MHVWKITDADRDEHGRIWVTPPARTLADLLPAAPKEEEEHTPRTPWRPSRLEVAGLAGGLILAVALIALVQSFTPAPAPQSVPTVVPTTAPTVTIAPTIATQDGYASPEGARLGTVPLTSTLAYRHSDYPGWGGIAWENGTIIWVQTDPQGLVSLPDLAPVPTSVPRRPVEAPVVVPVVPQPAVCDPQNPPYQVRQQVGDLGHVVGFSCISAEEAQANADMLAAEMIAAASPAPSPLPSEAR